MTVTEVPRADPPVPFLALSLWFQVAQKQIWGEEELDPAAAEAASAVAAADGKGGRADADADPTSVLYAAYRDFEGDSSGSSSTSGDAPASPLGYPSSSGNSRKQRDGTAGALHSHPLLDLPGEDEEEECFASARSPAAASRPSVVFGSCAALTASFSGSAGATTTPRTWYRCLEALLQALRGSDATSGVAPNASLLLEEMAVLI